MHDLPILINITLALVVAFIGGIIARKVGLPSIVGYLLAGIIIGPFTPGFVGDVATIQQLAELGVIFLMFGVGLHFSFQDLWRVRDIAIPGALLQTLIATLLGFGLTQLWGWTPIAGIVLGLSISVASTVVLLRGLIDNSLLNTSHGQAAVGWLVMEDILSVFILVLMPAMANGSEGFNWGNLAITLLKAAAFIVIMFLVGVRALPWLLEKIAHTHSRELFVLAIMAITLGTAMGASELFGVSLALGAFVAGAIISQSRLSHQVGADLFSFREIFSILFFVSIGMLVNPSFLWENITHVILLTLLVIVGKFTIVVLMGTLFPRPARTFLVVAVGLSQVGEFSFILGQSGMSLGMLETNQYSLILAAALISITVNPFMYKALPFFERTLKKVPRLWKKLEANIPIPEVNESQLVDHVVLIGYGRVGQHLVEVLTSLNVPLLVIESDMERVEILNEQCIATLYGDAANSEVLPHAHLERAKALVITSPDETASEMAVAIARSINPNLPIIARAASQEGVHLLANLGASHIVHPELEGGLEMVQYTLLQLGFPLREVHEYTEAVRRDRYDFEHTSSDEHRTMRDLIGAFNNIEITWFKLTVDSPLTGKTLGEADIRSQTGASVVALIRDHQLTPNPKSSSVFYAGDRVGLIGEKEQVENVRNLLIEPPAPPPPYPEETAF
jgi:CPA2 family monovalent cation:H+ antiporter-2